MKFKPDWDEAQERLTALWKGRPIDRPCIGIQAPSGKKPVPPVPPVSDEMRWMDPAWNVRNALCHLESTWWGGESVPSYLLMCGWVVCLGGEPGFAPGTIWHKHMDVDFNAEPPFDFNMEDPWFVRHEEAYRALAEAAGYDDFLVGQPCILPANDLLSMLMGTENFLVALCEHPDWMKRALAKGTAAQIHAFNYLADCIKDKHRFWYGCPGWMPFWAPEPFWATQSDVSCMVSPQMYDEFILPDVEANGRRYGSLWYHLDGGDAKQHLPRLLSMPYLRVLQYTPAPCEPPNGPAHIDFYRKVQSAGKIVHIQVAKEDVEPLCRALDPSRLVLSTWCSSIAEGEALLESAKRWTASRGRGT